MDSDSWIRLSTSSRRNQSRSDFYNIGEEYEGEEESRPEFLCPFCGEDFDIVGLCCHIDDEHAIEAKNGICPVCAKKVGGEFGWAYYSATWKYSKVGNVSVALARTIKHSTSVLIYCWARLCNRCSARDDFVGGGSNSTLSILRKELREGSLQSILRGSSHLISSSTTDPDPLLSSFINSSALVDEPPEVQPLSSAKACSTQDSAVENLSDRNFQPSPLSEEDQEEKARKSKFVQGLLLSTFLEDDF